MRVHRVLPLVAGLLLGASQVALAAEVTFVVNDTPGYWFDLGLPDDKNPNKPFIGTRSLAVIPKGSTVHFTQTVGPKAVESRHTVTSLIWPANATEFEPGRGVIDQDSANMKDHLVKLDTAGLYVFVCKLHPYMLGAVVVDDENTKGLDLGQNLVLLGGPNGHIPFPTNSDLGLRALRAFFIVTNRSNWKDYTKIGTIYQPDYPPVAVNVGPVSQGQEVVVNLKEEILKRGYDGGVIEKQHTPHQKGIGEVWVDTAYELTKKKNGPPLNEDWFPGTMTVVSATKWDVTKKIALPDQKMNNGHNFWTSHDQKEIYQTEWHGNSVYVIDRKSGKLLQDIDFSKEKTPCHDPAHVMTRVDTQQVHVGCNGDDDVVEFNRDPSTGLLSVHQFISMSGGVGKQTQPHAHWMGYDGRSMITPNSNTGDSTLFQFRNDAQNLYQITRKEGSGTLPIATGLMPDSSKSYVSNYLGHTISVMCGPYPKPDQMDKDGNKPCLPGNKITDIQLLAGYDPITGANTAGLGITKGLLGGFSVQTPVSPDGKFVIQGNTLSGTITIIDTKTDKLVKSIPCDPGCHGVNFGAKKGGGYYAYVTSKFANRLIVLDYDPDNNGDASDAVIAGTVVLANDNPAYKDDSIIDNRGMGAQGIMAVPNVYNGWVQRLPGYYKAQLTKTQRNPIGKKGHKHYGDDDDDRGHDRDDDR
jgi:DNA-binding beta-propeller fold protein YncE